MIPKIIHYCWFGSQELPAKYQHYLASWQKNVPIIKLFVGMKPTMMFERTIICSRQLNWVNGALFQII